MTTQEKMDTHKIIQRPVYSNYTLLNRKTSYCTYVVAWHFDDRDYTWAQGHYFNDLREAKLFWYERERDAIDEYVDYYADLISTDSTQQTEEVVS